MDTETNQITEFATPRDESLAGLNLLVVEDDAPISMLIEELLSDHGGTIVGPYATVADGLKAAETADIGFALLDISIAGQKVYPVADALEARGIPFLLMSGYGQQGLPNNRPGWRVIGKPFSLSQLVAILVKEWGSRQQ